MSGSDLSGSTNDPFAEATAQVNESDVSFLYSLVQAPCFRETALYSIGGGSVIGALHLHRVRDPIKAAETMVKSGCALATLHWILCRRRYYMEREMTYSMMEARKQQAAARRSAAAAAAREKEGS